MKDSLKYYNDIKRAFPIKGKQEREYLKEIKEQIYEYEIDHEHCTYQELTDEFGIPNDIVESYLNEMHSGTIAKKLNTMKMIKICIITIMLFGAIVTAFKLYKAQLLYEQVRDHQPAYYEEIIEED